MLALSVEITLEQKKLGGIFRSKEKRVFWTEHARNAMNFANFLEEAHRNAQTIYVNATKEGEILEVGYVSTMRNPFG